MLSSDAITSTAIVVVHTCTMKYISLMPELNNADALEDNVLRNFGGAVENNLNHVLGNLSDTSEDLAIFTHSSYIDTSQLDDKLTSSKDKFTVFSLNTQSIHAKFNYLYPLFFWTSVIRTLVLAPYVCRKHGSRRMTTLLYTIFPIIILSTRVKHVQVTAA